MNASMREPALFYTLTNHQETSLGIKSVTHATSKVVGDPQSQTNLYGVP